MKSLKLKSPAKLNLYLRVLNKRPDGYHNIVTLFERIGLFDEISLKDKKSGGIEVVCDNPKAPNGQRNLACKAAKALLDYTGKEKSVFIRIKKRIPIGAGLGGGSSNAATVLLGLNRLWKLRLSKKELMKIGAKIGADVNFFLLDKKLAIGAGIGENLRPFNIKRPIWHVLVAPGNGLSTRDIYEYWDNMYDKGKISPSPHSDNNMRLGTENSLTAARRDVKILLHSIRNNDLTLLAKGLHNDLEEPAGVKKDTIFKIKAILSSCKAKGALMSGSGSAVFGIVPSEKDAVRIRREITRLKRGWQIFTVRTW